MSITVTTSDETDAITITTTDMGDGTALPSVGVVASVTADPFTIELLDEPPLNIDINDTGMPGPPGVPGPRGPQGDVGPAGITGMTFTQDIPATTWLIPHGFTYWPSVTVLDTGGNEIETEIHQALGLVTVSTALPTAGRAYLI